MPLLSRWFIKFSLMYLLGGFGLGALILIQKGVGAFPAVWQWLPVHIELVIFGWILQLVMGVAYWILPRFGTERRREALAVMAFGFLNAGIGLTVTATAGGFSALIVTARLMELLAVLCFILHAWPRVKAFGEG